MDVRKQQQQGILQQEILQWTSGALRGGAMVVRKRQQQEILQQEILRGVSSALRGGTMGVRKQPQQEILQETGTRRDARQKRVLQRTGGDPRRRAGKTLTRMMSSRGQMMRRRCQKWRHKALTRMRSLAEGRPGL